MLKIAGKQMQGRFPVTSNRPTEPAFDLRNGPGVILHNESSWDIESAS